MRKSYCELDNEKQAIIEKADAIIAKVQEEKKTLIATVERREHEIGLLEGSNQNVVEQATSLKAAYTKVEDERKRLQVLMRCALCAIDMRLALGL